jgi:hypothetical protein
MSSSAVRAWSRKAMASLRLPLNGIVLEHARHIVEERFLSLEDQRR